jgi:hypothetical protein
MQKKGMTMSKESLDINVKLDNNSKTAVIAIAVSTVFISAMFMVKSLFINGNEK